MTKAEEIFRSYFASGEDYLSFTLANEVVQGTDPDYKESWLQVNSEQNVYPCSVTHFGTTWNERQFIHEIDEPEDVQHAIHSKVQWRDGRREVRTVDDRVKLYPAPEKKDA